MLKTLNDEQKQELAWDNRELGAEEDFARKVSPERAKAIREELGLHSISLRLQIEIIEQLKGFAKEEGIGYQPLIRQILTRYVRDRTIKKLA